MVNPFSNDLEYLNIEIGYNNGAIPKHPVATKNRFFLPETPGFEKTPKHPLKLTKTSVLN